MKEFLQEWGTTILTGIAVMALVAIIILLKPTMQSAFEGMFDKFSSQMDRVTDTEVTAPTTEAPTPESGT